MSRSVIEGRTFRPDGSIADCSITVEDEVIVSVEPLEHRSERAEPEDHLIVPGFIDLHVHGGGGFDFSDAAPEEIESILRCHGAGGTCALAATIVSSSPDTTLRAIETLVSVESPDDGPEICAIHLEGPFLSRSKCGAQNPDVLRAPDTREVEEWLTAADGMPLIVTLAPELEGAIELIESFPEIRISLGHTEADYRTAISAFEAGACRITHLFNAMRSLHHRDPGLLGAALLTPGINAELIADGHHIHPAILQLAARLLPGRSVLVTDAISAAGSPNATAVLGGLDVEISDGAARLRDGTLAGSVITMRDALSTMVERAGVPIEVVLPMMTTTPAKEIALETRKGRIEPRMDADLVILDSRMKIVRRIVRGRET